MRLNTRRRNGQSTWSHSALLHSGYGAPLPLTGLASENVREQILLNQGWIEVVHNPRERAVNHRLWLQALVGRTDSALPIDSHPNLDAFGSQNLQQASCLFRARAASSRPRNEMLEITRLGKGRQGICAASEAV
eukprot:scaffold16513_cov79-Phaeocystis_antarctica.AAC.2